MRARNQESTTESLRGIHPQNTQRKYPGLRMLKISLIIIRQSRTVEQIRNTNMYDDNKGDDDDETTTTRIQAFSLRFPTATAPHKSVG